MEISTDKHLSQLQNYDNEYELALKILCFQAINIACVPNGLALKISSGEWIEDHKLNDYLTPLTNKFRFEDQNLDEPIQQKEKRAIVLAVVETLREIERISLDQQDLKLSKLRAIWSQLAYLATLILDNTHLDQNFSHN